MGKARRMEVSAEAVGDPARARLRAALALCALAALAVTFLAGPGPAHAATYKWVDEKGVVHYTDKMPPEAVDKATVELNKEGVAIKKTDKALTPEQRRAIEADAERQRQLARQQEDDARRDRALVASYTSEAEIDLARNRSLQTIKNVVQSTRAFSEQLNKRRAEVEQKKIEFKGKPIVTTLDREIEGIDAELARQAELVAQKKRESELVIAKYEADKQRWRELVAANKIPDPAKPVGTPDYSAAPAGSSAPATPKSAPAKKN